MENELNNQVVESQQPEVEQQEKMVPQSQVNAIVQREKAYVAEKAAREAEERVRREYEERQPKATNAQNQGYSADDIRELARKEYEEDNRRKQAEHERRRREEFVEQISRTYTEKMTGKEVPEGFAPEDFPEIVTLLSQSEFRDDMHEIIKEIASNENKLASIDYLSKKNSPAAAIAGLRKVQKSIKQNQEALNNKPNVRQPHSQLKPSNVTMNIPVGDMGISDFKRGFMKKR